MRRLFKDHPVIPLLILTNAVFFILYRNFIFGDAVFMYSDVGSDSLSSSYPIIAELSRLFETRTFSHYTIWSGLGQDTTATFLQYINPFKLMLLFFGRDNFPAGIMLYLFIQNNLIAVFAYNTFRLLSGNAAAALLPALAWTFSSYIVVWGQNYSYGCCMLMFTIMIFLVERVLRRDTLSGWLVLTLWLALFFLSNYYFFYMCGIFSALYVFFRSLMETGENGKMKTVSRLSLLLSREFKLLFCAVGALLMAAAPLLAIASSFLGSARSGDTGAASLRSLLLPYDLHTYGTYLARLFSADLIGAGSAFSGSASYYDAALLSATLVAFFAMLFLLLRKESAVKTLLFAGIAFLMLFFQGTGRVLTFNPISQRYSFIILFMEMIAVTFFMRSLLEEDGEMRLRIVSALAPVLMAAALFVLVRGSRRFAVAVRRETLITVAVFIFLWASLLMSSTLIKGIKKARFALMALLLAAELIALNDTSLNSRVYLTKDSFANDFFNDGTQQAVADVLAADADLYRISASEEYDMANEGLVDGYMSSTSYSNTTSASAASLDRAYASYEISSNFFRAGYRNYYLYTMLGGRYLITDEPDNKSDSLEPGLFSLVAETETQRTFKNENALPFGYVYEEELDSEEFARLSSFERVRALTKGYIATDEIAYPLPELGPDPADTSRFDLIPRIHTPSNVALTNTEPGITINATGPDPYFFFDLTEALSEKGSDEVQYLHVAVDKAAAAAMGNITFELFTMTEDHPDLSEPIYELISVNAAAPEMNFLLPDGVTVIRMDIPEGSVIPFTDISLLTAPDPAADFAALKNTDIRDISFENDVYRASVTTENGGMLCIPLLYSGNWTALVNGSPAPVENINGGLIGVYLPAGEADVTLTYALPKFSLAVSVSLIACGVWVVLFILSLFSRK